MASIQSLGVGSGLLTSELVEDIVAAERKSTDLRLNARRAEYEARISAYGSIKSSLETLRTSADALGQSDSLLTKTATSSLETSVRATASAEAAVGHHSVEVLSLARSHTLASIRFEDINSSVGNGTLSFRFGETTFDGGGAYDTFSENIERAPGQITIDESNNTLAGIRDTINEANVGVRASIINDGEGYVLIFTSENTGNSEGMEIIVSEGTEPGLAAFSFNSAASTPGVNMTQTVAADDALVNINGVVIRRDKNTIDEVIPGVQFEILSLNAGAPATLSIAQDTTSIESRMSDFIEAFNSTRELTDKLTDFDEDSKQGALLMGDATLRGIRNQMRRFLSSSVANIQNTDLRSLTDLGITTNQNNNFNLQLDVTKLRQALQSAPQDVAALLAEEGRTSDPLVRFTRSQRATEAGSYDIDISQVATQGRIQGQSVASLARRITINGDNNALSVRIDGIDSGPINLTQQRYDDGHALAEELEARINASNSLKTAEKTVSVEYDADNERFVIQSTSYGEKSRVDITGIDNDTLAELGLDVVSGESSRGLNVQGFINGIAGQGIGQFLSVPLGPAPATSARFAGSTIASFPVVIDNVNNEFVLEVDGTTSAQLAIAPGTYNTGEELAVAIQAAVDADANFSTDEVTLDVRFDIAANRLIFTSESTGSQSTVRVISRSDGLQIAAGIDIGEANHGRNAAARADSAAGLQVQVIGGDNGSRGDITLVRGIMNRFDRFLDSALKLDGSVDAKLETLEDQLKSIDEESNEFNQRMDTLEDRLRFQFAAADALISQLNSTSQFLEQQLAALPGYRDNNSN